jgi:hypothetical protein
MMYTLNMCISVKELYQWSLARSAAGLEVTVPRVQRHPQVFMLVHVCVINYHHKRVGSESLKTSHHVHVNTIPRQCREFSSGL